MTSAIHFTYITGPQSAIQRAWSSFEAATQMPDVHFIPAMGGCFVVLQGQEPGRLFASLARLMSSKEEPIEGALERFKRHFEGVRSFTDKETY